MNRKWVIALALVVYAAGTIRWIAGSSDASPPPPTTVDVRQVTAEEVQQLWNAKFKRSMTFATRATNTDLVPHFDFMFPKEDLDAQQPLAQGVLEPFVTHNMYKHLRTCCAAGGHFTDVGGNYGWFAMQAAAMGCDVDTFEPMEHYALLMEYNLYTLNKFDRRKVVLHKDTIVGSVAGERVTMGFKLGDTLGGVAVNVGGETSKDVATTVTLDGMIDKLVRPGRRECGLKVDVEGYEPFVFQGGEKFVDMTQPQAVIIENSPMMTKNFVPGQTVEAAARLLGDVLDKFVNHRGYDVNRFHWGIIKHEDMNYHLTNSMHALREDMRFVPHNMTRFSECGFNCMVYLSRDGFGEALDH